MEQKKNKLAMLLIPILLALSCVPTASSIHYVLVHGSCHGAWSWYKVVALLRSSGHRVTALDLAASGIDPAQAKDLRSVSDYFRPVTAFVEALPPRERVVLVGHSFGGYAISYVMELFPSKVSVAVFVTAFMPGPSLDFPRLNLELLRRQHSQLDNSFTDEEGPNGPTRTSIFGPLYLSTKMYRLSPSQDLELAKMLLRPRRLFNENDMSNVLTLTEERYGTTCRVYIVAGDDEVIKEDLQRWMIEKNPPDEVETIRGSDHMVMLSQPMQLFLRLQYIGYKYSSMQL